jgi:type I restriction enzyme S subunit
MSRWPTTRLSDLADIKAGFAWKSESFSENPKSGPPIIRIQNLGMNENAVFVYYNGKIEPGYWVEEGDLLVSLSGSFKACLWKGPRALLNQRIVLIRSSQEINKEFLFYQISKRLKEISNAAVGIAVANASMGAVRDMEVSVPSKTEQDRIVKLLDEADALRKLRAQADRRAADLIPAIFQEMFGEIGLQSCRWPVERLGKLITIESTLVDPRESAYQDLPHIGADRIERNNGKLLPGKTAREDGLISAKFLFDERDVLYSKIRPYLKKVALPKTKGLCSADMYPIRPGPQLVREFLWAYLLTDHFTGRAVDLSARANMPKLNRAQLDSINAPVPPLSLQSEFAKRVSEIESIETGQASARRRLNDLFQSILAKAFNDQLVSQRDDG